MWFSLQKVLCNGFEISAINYHIIILQAIGQQKSVVNARQEAFNIRRAGMHTGGQQQQLHNKSALEMMFRPAGSAAPSESSSQGYKRKINEAENEDSDDDQAHDEVRLWEDGFKERYYESKFDIRSDNLEFRWDNTTNDL